MSPPPPNIAALFETARAHHQAGRLQEAGALYQQILAETPDHAPSLHLLGVVALQIGQAALAINLIGAAVAKAPDHAAYRNDLGEALRASGDLDGAAQAFAAVIAITPDHAGAHVNLGIVRQEQARFVEALDLYRRATEINPALGEAWNNLGTLLTKLERWDEAESALKRAQHLQPADISVRLNQGNLSLEQGRLEPAVAVYETILAEEPTHVAALLNLGRAMKELGRPADALRLCREAERIDPGNPMIRWNLGLCRLLLGDWRRGWQGFEARFEARSVAPTGIDGPAWDGTPLPGGTLLLHSEQGLGDTIQFVRFVAAARSKATAKIRLACQPALISLLEGVAGIDEIIPRDGPLGRFDAHAALMSLPAILEVTPQSIPPAPYLAADPIRTGRWENRLGPGFKVGLVWQGHRLHRNDKNRSIPAAALTPLLGVTGVRWFSLQRDPTAADLASLPGLRDLSADLTDFAATAAIIAALDLVITVDTAVAHLAGALGRPVWLALPYAPDWRWLMGRSDSPWYASARLFRQSMRGVWTDPIAAMRTALAQQAR